MMDNYKLAKRDQKHSKILQKQLQEINRQAQAMNRKYDDKNYNGSDQDNEVVDKKAKRWWDRLDERNFSVVRQKDYQYVRDITTSDRILQQSPKQLLPLTTYSQQRIFQEYDLFADNGLLHVLFKSKKSTFRCLVSYQIQQVIPSYSDQRKEKQDLTAITITPSLPHVDLDAQKLRQIKLSLAGYSQDSDVCLLVEDYKAVLDSGKCEVDRQVQLWERELLLTNRNNSAQWDKLYESMRIQHNQTESMKQISSIKEYLMWVTVLKYFEHGHRDKTMEMLQILIQSQKLARPSKSTTTVTKKFFQTDCKICFCSLNNDSNQVLYCDQCNTSFHLACYGLQEVPKEDIYYCDCCKFLKKNNAKKVQCQLCAKTSFPIKDLDGHFYHITCLILFNFGRISQGSLILREGITHHKIMQMVVKSEVEQQQCQFCCKFSSSAIGIRFRCANKDCQKSAHPICAYINGCKFNVKRSSNNQLLQTSYICNSHDKSRDQVQQSYIRRYMCNLKETSHKNLEEFRKYYFQEERKRLELQGRNKNWDYNRIIAKTKFIKRMFQFQQNKSCQQNGKVETESRRMLEKLYKRQQQ